jgi:hypothetical protein
MWKERVILQILDNFIHIYQTSLLKWLYITAENLDPLFISGLCGLYMDIPSQKLLTYWYTKSKTTFHLFIILFVQTNSA